MFKINKKSESGRSMVELVGVLAIMGMISAAAFLLINSGMASQKRTIVIDDVAKIVSGVRTLYADYDDLSGLNGADAMAAMEINENGPFDGTTYSVAKDSSDNANFVVTISGLPDDECVILGERYWADSVGHTECNSGTVTITYEK